MPIPDMSSPEYLQYIIDEISRKSPKCGLLYDTLVKTQQKIVEEKLIGYLPEIEKIDKYELQDYSWKLFVKIYSECYVLIDELIKRTNLSQSDFNECIKKLSENGNLMIKNHPLNKEQYVSIENDGVIYPLIYTYFMNHLKSKNLL